MSGNSADSFSEDSEAEEEKEEVKEKAEVMVKKKGPGRPPRKKRPPAPPPPPTVSPPISNAHKRRCVPQKSGNSQPMKFWKMYFLVLHFTNNSSSTSQESVVCWSVPGQRQSVSLWRLTWRGTSWSCECQPRLTVSAVWNFAPCWWATIEIGEPSSFTSTTASSSWRSRAGGRALPLSVRTHTECWERLVLQCIDHQQLGWRGKVSGFTGVQPLFLFLFLFSAIFPEWNSEDIGGRSSTGWF